MTDQNRPRTIALSYAGYDQDTCTTRQVLTVPGVHLVAIRTHTMPQPAQRVRWNVLDVFDVSDRDAPWYLRPDAANPQPDRTVLTASDAARIQPAQESPLPTVLTLNSDEMLAIEHGTVPPSVSNSLPRPPLLPMITAVTAAAFPGDSEGGLTERIQTFTEAAITNPESLRGFTMATLLASGDQDFPLVRAADLHAADLDMSLRALNLNADPDIQAPL